MTMENVKEFVKEHKKGIIIGCVSVTAAIASALLLKSKIEVKPCLFAEYDNVDDAKKAIEGLCSMATIWDEACDGAKFVSTWKVAEDAAMFADNIFTDSDGDTMKVTGAILFGNKVET